MNEENRKIAWSYIKNRDEMKGKLESPNHPKEETPMLIF